MGPLLPTVTVVPLMALSLLGVGGSAIESGFQAGTVPEHRTPP